MIENLKYDEKTVSWNTKSGKRVEKTHNSISNVLTNSKEVYVLYRENDRDDVVIVYSGKGELLGELHNTDVMYINYLQNHPRYGVVIIISEKINEKWIDGQYQFSEGQLIRLTNTRCGIQQSMEGIRSIYGIASARSMGILTVIRQYGHQKRIFPLLFFLLILIFNL